MTRIDKMQAARASEEYNGYRNYKTWNVALWINNDSSWYEEAAQTMTIKPNVYPRRFLRPKISSDEHVQAITAETSWEYNLFEHFADNMRALGIVETPDQVALNDSALDTEALSEIVSECLPYEE